MSLSAGSRLGPGDVDAPYVVQELPEDETLRSVLAGSRLSPSRELHYSIQIVRGLAAAHEKGSFTAT